MAAAVRCRIEQPIRPAMVPNSNGHGEDVQWDWQPNAPVRDDCDSQNLVGGLGTAYGVSHGGPQRTDNAEPAAAYTGAQKRMLKRQKTAADKEIQLLLPKALVKNLVKSRAASLVSANTTVASDAIDAIVKAATVFVSYAAVCSHELSVYIDKPTVDPGDVTEAVGLILPSAGSAQFP